MSAPDLKVYFDSASARGPCEHFLFVGEAAKEPTPIRNQYRYSKMVGWIECFDETDYAPLPEMYMSQRGYIVHLSSGWTYKEVKFLLGLEMAWYAIGELDRSVRCVGLFDTGEAFFHFDGNRMVVSREQEQTARASSLSLDIVFGHLDKF